CPSLQKAIFALRTLAGWQARGGLIKLIDSIENKIYRHTSMLNHYHCQHSALRLVKYSGLPQESFEPRYIPTFNMLQLKWGRLSGLYTSLCQRIGCPSW